MTPLSIASSSVRYSLMETGSLWLLSLRKKSISIIRGQGRNYSAPQAAMRAWPKERNRIITEERYDHHPRSTALAHRRHPDPDHAAAAQLHRGALPHHHRHRRLVRPDPHRAVLIRRCGACKD